MKSEFQNIPFQNIVKFGQRTMLARPLFSVSWILGRFCNYNCSYCWPYARSDRLDYQEFETYTKTIDEIKGQARQNGFTDFHWSFSGGEPTIRRDLLDLFEYANQAGFVDIALHTNGRELKNYQLVEKMVELGLKRVLLSLHGQNAEIHDKITGSPNSFLEVLEGLRNLRAFSIEPTINIVMCQDNYRQLIEIVKFLGETLDRRGRIRFSYPIIEGAALENIDQVLVPFSQLKPSMLEALQLAEAMGFDAQVANMPLCIPDESHRDTTYDTQVLSEFVEVSPFYQFNVPRGEKSVKLNSCIECSKANLCRGIQIEYLRTYPKSSHEFSPIRKEIQ
jgi:sulfatase maturation enzyme AslB (radical SAM superfamily)